MSCHYKLYFLPELRELINIVLSGPNFRWGANFTRKYAPLGAKFTKKYAWPKFFLLGGGTLLGHRDLVFIVNGELKHVGRQRDDDNKNKLLVQSTNKKISIYYTVPKVQHSLKALLKDCYS